MDSRIISPARCAWFLLGTVLMLAAAGGPASAQTRSDTGRHQPPPPPEETDAERSELPTAGRPVWHAGMAGGIIGGGDLFRVEVVNGTPVPWVSLTRFQSSRYTATLDRNVGFGLFLARDLGPTWTLRADLGYSRMDVAAEALVGQTGAVFLYDRMDVVNAGLGVEARLTSQRSHPFVAGSVVISRLDPGWADELAQTNWGARLGMGYLHSFRHVWGLRFEARLTRTAFSLGDFVPPADTYTQPEIRLEGADHLLFFEFLIGLQASF